MAFHLMDYECGEINFRVGFYYIPPDPPRYRGLTCIYPGHTEEIEITELYLYRRTNPYELSDPATIDHESAYLLIDAMGDELKEACFDHIKDLKKAVSEAHAECLYEQKRELEALWH